MAKRTATAKLKEYDAKRDFAATPEPPPKVKPSKAKKGLSFCVQKHLASHLHYDFRLEHEGVLLSWAVPKGPSLNPADKRLAMQTEDHPLDYGGFEGVIPSGYGAGVVSLWDRGTWTPDPKTPDVNAALAKGELKFSLDGVKLKGSWVLVRTRRDPRGKQQWLLMKHRDQWAGEVDVLTLAPQSVKSFGDLPEILAKHGPDTWGSKNAPPVRGGETGAIFRDVIARAREISSGAAESAKTPAKKATKSAKATKSVKSSKASKSARKPVKSAAVVTVPKAALSLGDKRPKLSNLNKVLFPATGFTKGQLIDYYTRIAPLILPHLVGRAATLKRYPDGVESKMFFEKRCASHRPDWVKTLRVKLEGKDEAIDYCEIADVSTLTWVANLAAIELHVPLALGAKPEQATAMVFDLDPGPPADVNDCVPIALRLKGMLEAMGLQSMLKTSGGKGLHLLIPLNTPGVTFDQTKAFARAVALTLERDDPKHVIASMAKVDRTGKIFIDWSQNDRNKTTVCVFSVRARQEPTVSWPINWETIAGGKAPRPFRADRELDLDEAQRVTKILSTAQRLPTGGAAGT